MDRKIRLPKEGFIDEQDVEGHLGTRRQGENQPGPEEARSKALPNADAPLPAGEEDTEAHRFMARNQPDDHAGEGVARRVADDDVEGHIGGRPGSPDDLTLVPAPPSLGLRRTPGHGGELTADDDVKGPNLRR